MRLNHERLDHRGIIVMTFNDENFAKFVDFVRGRRLPMHITAGQIADLFGPAEQAFCDVFPRVTARLKEVAGLWMESVLCPQKGGHPQTYYVTVYREGQKSLFPDARAPAAGPYWIPDEARS